MKLAKFFGVLFGLCGVALMVFTAVLCLSNLDGEITIREYPIAAENLSEDLMRSLTAGDTAAARSCLYGKPELGDRRAPENAAAGLIWDAFSDSLSYEFAGQCYGTHSGICRDVTVTSLDVSAVTGRVEQIAQELVEEKVQAAIAAEDMTQVYGEDGALRADVADELFHQAVSQALLDSSEAVRHEITLQLVYENGSWWVLPNETLLKAVSGGV